MSTDLTHGALGAWLDEPGPRPTPEHPSRPDPDSATGDPDSPIADGEIERMRDELSLIRARAQLQRDPAWLDELSPSELAAEREAAETIRARRRDTQLSAAVAATKLGDREQRVEQRLARMELADRMWSRRATARRMRLLDPTSRLASLHRTHLASTAALSTVALAGIAWTSMGVHDALVGPVGNPAAYLVEPIFSVPLLVIMGLSARASQWGRTFPPPDKQGRIYALEGFLLASTIAMNTASVLPGAGTWHNLATLLAHLLPPVLIVIAVALQPLVAGFLAEVLTTAQLDAGAQTTQPEPRLDDATMAALTLVGRVQAALDNGELVKWDNTGLPSISAIQRYLRCSKTRAQMVWDAMKALRSENGPPHSVAPPPRPESAARSIASGGTS
jgi:hypothetical protein